VTMDTNIVASTHAEASGVPARPLDASDCRLYTILSSLLEDPPLLPGWPPGTWRAALRRSCGVEDLSRTLVDVRLQPVLAWVASRAVPTRHLGALAEVLAVLDAELTEKTVNAAMLARRIEEAVIAARQLAPRHSGQARVAPSPSTDMYAAPSASTAARDESPFSRIASTLLKVAGHEPQADDPLMVRLAAALDVALDHWMRGAERGGGLPPFTSEHRLRSTHRLAVRLGRDRDLLHLVYGPQPGRGRDLQTARRRGLAYWVAATWCAEHLGGPVPAVPAPVVAHWRKELGELRIGSSRELDANSWDAPGA
jgi:hypothetical protein